MSYNITNRRMLITPALASGAAVGPLVYTATATSVAWQQSANPMTFSSVSIGTASSDRIVVVSVFGYSASDVTGITIGGVSATQAVVSNVISAVAAGVQIYYLLVTSGTTANIVVTGAGTLVDCAISVGIITGSATATVSATNSSAWAGTSDPHSLTTTVPSNGVGVIAAAIDRAATLSWSNATQDSNNQEGAGSFYTLGQAHTTNNSPSFTGANGFTVGLAAVTFGP